MLEALPLGFDVSSWIPPSLTPYAIKNLYFLSDELLDSFSFSVVLSFPKQKVETGFQRPTDLTATASLLACSSPEPPLELRYLSQEHADLVITQLAVTTGKAASTQVLAATA